jgi:hypothetical protein
MNYTQLTTAIQDYIEASDSTFVANIPNFVQATEQKVYNSVQLPALRKNVTGTTTAGNKYLGQPSDWLATYSISVITTATGEQTYLLNKNVDYIREAFPYPATTGRPTHYAIFNNTTFILGPTPDAAYSTELHYFYYPQSIVTAGTSWLGDNFDTVLLYGSLVEANMFIKGEADTTAAYQKQFDEALDKLKSLAEGKDTQDSYRSGQVRRKVV